eukprot:sb/3461416/
MSSDVRKICKLDEVVINRIAAGEVVQRPCNAIKELIENSIDAGSTSITVSVDEGGLKCLQISDNGHGIRKDDLGIVCERFTTSKLKTFSDLRSIATHGFRGEALASISHVSNLSIQTRTASEKCAWLCNYLDGKPVSKKDGCTSDPRPIAGNVGTTITAEDLFYNMATRRRALNGRDEMNKIAQVISCYALHNAHIAFTLRKQGDNTPKVKTAPTEERTRTVSSLYGPVLAKELLPFTCDDKKFGFRSTGLLTNANYGGKSFRFVLFINGRLVESTGAKRAFEAVYSSVLPKNSYPFVYLSLEIDPGNVDVNVHPTKNEVHFLHEEAILAGIQAKAQQTLYSSTSSRNYYTQAKLPCVDVSKEVKEARGNKENAAPYDYQLVRTDVNQQKLDIFLSDNKPAGTIPTKNPIIPPLSDKPGSSRSEDKDKPGPSRSDDQPQTSDEDRVPVYLTSILQLQEDIWHGIRKDDLGIVCERFTTSKLKTFSDLRSIATHGFRGEALASISHVSNLSIQTRTASEKCAWLCNYLDGKPVSKKDGCTSDPRPIAGNVGTTITAEDLFYNMATRRRALNGRDEMNKIAHVISCYALHNAHIAFTLRKQGDNTPKVKTAPTEDRTRTVSSLYGPVLAKELLPFTCDDKKFGFRSTGLLTNANYGGKSFRFVLFINGRLVESTGAKRAFEAVYSSVLPKNSYPFVYLSLEIDPGNVDVNVHPTKNEVHFLHEEAILAGIQAKAQQTLYSSTSSRNYYTQAKLPCVDVSKEVKEARGNKENAAPYDYQLVRTDVNQQKLDIFLSDNKPAGTIPTKNPIIPPLSDKPGSSRSEDKDKPGPSRSDDQPQTSDEDRVPVYLTSVLQLQEDICKARHEGATDMFRESTFVGAVNEKLALVQVLTKLYLMDYGRLSRALVYQKVVFDFRNMPVFRLSEGACIREMALLALGQSESGWREDHGPKEELADLTVRLLVSKREMLSDYFSLEITEKGILTGLPVVIDNYPPLLQRLPMFLLRLSTEVDWDSERGCFEGISREIARFYTLTEPAEGDPNIRDWKFTLENVLWPQIRTVYIPDETVTTDGTVLQIADLHNLYKVFERC